MNLRYDRFKDNPLFVSNQNAELPIRNSFSQCIDVGTTKGINKPWDDSEVSDEEMDQLIEQENKSNAMGVAEIQSGLDIGSSIRFFR